MKTAAYSRSREWNKKKPSSVLKTLQYPRYMFPWLVARLKIKFKIMFFTRVFFMTNELILLTINGVWSEICLSINNYYTFLELVTIFYFWSFLHHVTCLYYIFVLPIVYKQTLVDWSMHPNMTYDVPEIFPYNRADHVHRGTRSG